MNKSKSQKGITLIALIITIIVLLILAVVTIGAVQNDGIIEYAKEARNSYETAQNNEQLALDSYLAMLEENNPNNEGAIDCELCVGGLIGDCYVCPECNECFENYTSSGPWIEVSCDCWLGPTTTIDDGDYGKCNDCGSDLYATAEPWYDYGLPCGHVEMMSEDGITEYWHSLPGYYCLEGCRFATSDGIVMTTATLYQCNDCTFYGECEGEDNFKCPDCSSTSGEWIDGPRYYFEFPCGHTRGGPEESATSIDDLWDNGNALECDACEDGLIRK